MRRLVLDTGVLLGLVLDRPWPALETCGVRDADAFCFTSIVRHAELLSLSRQRGWGREKKERVAGVLEAVPAIPVQSRELLAIYARVDAWSLGKEPGPNGEPPVQPSRTMGKNDLWVAATARLGQATLVTTDKDFEHLHEVWFDLRRLQTHELISVSQASCSRPTESHARAERAPRIGPAPGFSIAGSRRSVRKRARVGIVVVRRANRRAPAGAPLG